MECNSEVQVSPCAITCKNRKCPQRVNLEVALEQLPSSCRDRLTTSPRLLEDISDLARTVAKIMTICGIHECKSAAAQEVAKSGFLDYEEICDCDDMPLVKRLKKEMIMDRLVKETLMNRVEATLAYKIIKRAFKAFYFKDRPKNMEEEKAAEAQRESERADSMFCKPKPENPLEECVYVHAAKRTVEMYSRFEGLSAQEQHVAEIKIKMAYKKFYDRMITRRTLSVDGHCTCCMCARKRLGIPNPTSAPCKAASNKPRKPKNYVCPCVKRKQKPKYHNVTCSAGCQNGNLFCNCKVKKAN